MKKAIFSCLKMVFLLALIIVLDIPAKLVLLSCKRGLDQCSKAADILFCCTCCHVLDCFYSSSRCVFNDFSELRHWLAIDIDCFGHWVTAISDYLRIISPAAVFTTICLLALWRKSVFNWLRICNYLLFADFEPIVGNCIFSLTLPTYSSFLKKIGNDFLVICFMQDFFA